MHKGEYDQPENSLRLVITSDTHTKHRKLRVPYGDVFIHCGDFSIKG